MFVYILCESIPYEGPLLLSVWFSKILAEEEQARLKKQNPNDYFYFSEWPVKGGNG